MTATWALVRGAKGDEMRMKVKELGQVIRASYENGEAKEGLRKVARIAGWVDVGERGNGVVGESGDGPEIQVE